MPWLRTSICDALPATESYCICDDITMDVFTPGTVDGETQSFDCVPCGDYGLQVTEWVCCNLSGNISE